MHASEVVLAGGLAVVIALARCAKSRAIPERCAVAAMRWFMVNNRRGLDVSLCFALDTEAVLAKECGSNRAPATIRVPAMPCGGSVTARLSALTVGTLA